MGSTVVKEYNVSPYFDDFDETKNFHRILFKPGFSVQARELTQMQTAFQAQLDRFGQWAFKDGEKVVLGQTHIHAGKTALDYIKIETSFTHSSTNYTVDESYLNGFVGKTITGATTGVEFEVVKVIKSAGSDPHTLYGNYKKAGTNGSTTVFAAEEILSYSGPVYAKVKPNSDTPIGKGSFVSIDEGAYFVKGCFIYVPAEPYFSLDKYSGTPSYKVGLQITESTIDSATDTSLVDNAIGAPNLSAPGADRYKIETTLIKEPLDLASRATNDYIEICTITNGVTSFDTTSDNDSTLQQTLANRTKEESGNYAVNPYIVRVEDHASDAAKATLKVEGNISYVNGYRVDIGSTRPIDVDRPRGADDTRDVNLYQQTFTVGNYAKLTNSDGMPDTATFDEVDLHSVNRAGTPSGSNKIGTARVRAVQRVSGEDRAWLFDIKMNSGQNISSVKCMRWVDGSTLKFETDFAGTGGTLALFEPGDNSLVFSLPFEAVKSMRDPANTAQTNSSYTVKRYLSTNNNSASFTLSGGDQFVNTGSILAATFNNSTGALGDMGVATVTGGGTSITFTHIGGVAVSLNANTSIKFVASVSRSDIVEKTKALQTNGSVSGTLTSGRLSLAKADIKKIKTIVDANSNSVIDRFDLDNGQRDNFYAPGAVVLKSGFSNPGTITVTFDYYTHGAGDYFTADSYPAYADIPNFTGVDGTVKLRDCVDFRPRMNDAGTGFTGTGATVPSAGIVATSTAFISDISHYLSRVDLISLSQGGDFTLTKGESSDKPVAPETPENDMPIAEVILSPYVFRKEEIYIKPIDNRRFTMKDIAKLEKRVNSLEYYTSLSLLEQSAADVTLTDTNGDIRLHNGFIVDNFTGHSVGDSSNPEYSAAMDKYHGILRPQSINRNVNLVRAAGEANGTTSNGKALKSSKGVVTLPFTETNFIDQPYSSFFSNVNPYNIFSWAGIVDLSPESDEWKDVDTKPIIYVDDTSQYEQFVQMAEEEGILGTVWNEWQTTWAGTSVGTDVENITDLIEGRRGGGRWWEREQAGFRTITTTTTTTNQSRDGLNTSVGFDTITRSDGGKLVEMNVIPFIRSREVFFKAQLLKPNTIMYGFFDDTPIANFIKEKSYAEFSDQTGVVEHTGATAHPDGAGALQSNSQGVIEGSFIIPSNDALKFATGKKIFRLSDTNNNDKNSETTYAEAEYSAQGLLEVFQETRTSTKVPKLVYQEVNEQRTLVDVDVQEITEWEDPVAETILIEQEGGIFCSSVDIFFRSKAPNDGVPIRLTIRETRNGYPTQKVVPGGDKILYPSDVNIPTDMSANNSLGNANQATKFTFDFPVYLAHQVEYAIVLTSQCDDYEVYVAQMGGTDLTDNTKRITKQPYNGVFFSSQNASTWTPEQSRDLKFKLNRCNFTTGNHTLTLNNDVVPVKKLKVDSFYTTNGSNSVVIEHKNHGMYTTNASVTIAGVVGAGSPAKVHNIPITEFNKTHTITAFTHDTYTIETTTNANATGYCGGVGVTATENRYMDLIYPAIEQIQLPGTNIDYSMVTRTAESVNGSETAYQSKSAVEVLPHRNYAFDAPMMVGSSINETNNMSGDKSFALTCTFSTTSNFLSPVIDMNRTSIHCIQNRIGNTGSSELPATGGTEVSKYITKVVSLTEEADIATVYLTAAKPAGAVIDLYYRALPGGSGDSIAETAYIAATPVTTIPDSERFKEVRYDIDPAGTFSNIQFKIVMRTSNSAKPPMIKDFRALCST